MRVAALFALAALVAGCGGTHTHTITESQAPTPAPKVRAAPANPREVAVIRAWADTLSAGHIKAAARYFTEPALAENGSGELLLQSQRDVRAFNASLPCGAVLLQARRVAGGYTLAIFRLTDRRNGGGCGPGTGQRAATAFRFSNNRIKEWRRVPVPQFEEAQPRI